MAEALPSLPEPDSFCAMVSDLYALCADIEKHYARTPPGPCQAADNVVDALWHLAEYLTVQTGVSYLGGATRIGKYGTRARKTPFTLEQHTSHSVTIRRVQDQLFVLCRACWRRPEPGYRTARKVADAVSLLKASLDFGVPAHIYYPMSV